MLGFTTLAFFMFLAWPVPEDRLKDAAMQSGLQDLNEEYIPRDVDEVNEQGH